jgi:predicted ATP-grasp superfamily ATP-dependent carboligase
VQDPRQLYTMASEQPEESELDAPVLVHALNGFVDAGSAGRLAADYLLAELPHRVLATFDLDQVYDYRARRPPMIFTEDHWTSIEQPRLELRLVQDLDGRGFLLLTGPEPDVQWERFVAAVGQLVDHYEVGLTMGIHAIPMAVPHTRPLGITAHGNRPDLTRRYPAWVGTVQVPGHVAALLELRLGEGGHDVAGFAVHVPHYLSQADYPDAALTLLQGLSGATGLSLPSQELREAGERTRALVQEQVEEQPEVLAVVRSLEEQYDAFVRGRERSLLAADGDEAARALGLPDEENLPTADELGAELERFLAEENRRRGEA